MVWIWNGRYLRKYFGKQPVLKKLIGSSFHCDGKNDASRGNSIKRDLSGVRFATLELAIQA
jgi:hypothetical protein